MRRVLAAPFLLFLVSAASHAAAEPPPPWAYGFKDAAPVAAPTIPPIASGAPDTVLHSLPGTQLKFTRAQIADRFGPADWYPGDHPAMPAIVAMGRKPDVLACALCHYPNGRGRPENAPISGLPVNYGFVAYVPPGSLNRGRVVVTTGRGKTAPCGNCHGANLKGMGDVPGILGRSPSYMMRQMVDMRAKVRTGPGADLMYPVIGGMSNADLLAVAAFIASRVP